MIQLLKGGFNTEDKKRLLSNFFSLSVLQGANYILPLITLPYLVRVLGPEKFGLIMFAQAFIIYFNIFVEYGFNLSATREISIYRNNNEKISEIFSSVLIIKLIFICISLFLISMIIIFFSKFKQHWIIYYLSFGVIIGQAFFPIWFFQGIEKMKFITFFNILIKIIFTISIFIFVKDETDFLLVPVINSTGYILIGLISIFFVIFHFNIKLKLPSINNLKKTFIDGGHIFITRISSTIYTNSGTFLVGIFGTFSEAAYYNIAEKIVRVLQLMIQPIFQTIFPYVSNLYVINKKEAIYFLKKMYILIFLISLFIFLFILVSADLIISIVFGQSNEETVLLLKILSIVPFVGNLTHIFGVETLQAFGYYKEFLKIITKGTFLFAIISIPFVKFYSAVGMAFVIGLIETTVLLIVIKKVRNIIKQIEE